MQKLLLILPVLVLVGCGDDVDADLILQRVGDTTFNADNNGTLFPITLTEGTLGLEALNIVDLDADEETLILPEASTFNFFLNNNLIVEDAPVPPDAYEQLHVIMESGAGSLALRMAFAVTLSDTTVVNGEVNLSLAEEEEQIIDQVIDLTNEKNIAITVAFDPSKVLGGLDFDALGANGSFTIEAGTGDPGIDAALLTIEENLFTSFAFVAAQ